MLKVIDEKIHITRGDSGLIKVEALNDDNTLYTFKKDDIVRLNVFEKKNCSKVLLTIDSKVENPTQEVVIELTSSDTKLEDIINRPKTYWYEIILKSENKEQTIVGYDNISAKEFILYPEGKDEL